MAEIDSLIGTVFFFIITSIIFVIIFSGYTIYQTANYQISLDQTKQKINENKLETILTIDETYSRNNLINLLISSSLNNTYSTIYGDIELNSTIKKNFDFFFGENNYYLQIKPKINDIRLNILYDDGSYMSDLSNNGDFAGGIDLINQYFNSQDFKIDVVVNILSNTSNSPECSKYTSILCKTFNMDNIYSDVPLNEFYNSIVLNDPVKERFSSISLDKFQTDFYSINDWATFLSRVSINSYNITRSSAFSKKDIYVIFSDVLNLGSTNDSYFITDYYDLFDETQCSNDWNSCKNNVLNDWNSCENNICEPLWNDGVGEADFNNCLYSCNSQFNINAQNCNNDFISCRGDQAYISFGNYYYQYFCVENTNFSLSNIPVEKVKTIIEKNQHIVYPILIHNYNIDSESLNKKNYMIAYDNFNNAISFTSTSERDGGDTSTIYGKVGCEGTFENTTSRMFHRETFNEHVNQLNNISQISNGNLITYSNSNNFYETIKNLITATTSKYNSEFGTKKNITDKTIISKKINKDYIGESVELEIYLEVYNTNYQFNSSIEFVPLVNDYYNDSTNFYINLSYYKPINFASINGIEAQRVLTDKIDNLLYKYNLKFDNFIPTNPNGVQLNYVDISGINKNITIN